MSHAWASDRMDGAKAALKAIECAALQSEQERLTLDGIHSPRADGAGGGCAADAQAARLCSHMDREAGRLRRLDPSDIAGAASAVHGLAVAGMRKQAAAVALRTFCGMSYSQVAEAMGCPRSTAADWYRTGIEWLDTVGPARAVAGLGVA